MELVVELIKPKAERYSRELGQVVEVDIKQYTILVNKKGLGYVCEANGLPINWLPLANVYQPDVIRKLSEAVNAELIRLHGPAAGNRPVGMPDDQETVDKALEIAAKFADRENSVEGLDDENL